MIPNKILFSVTMILIFSIMIPANADIESPKKQLKKGIAIEEIQCNVELELIIRNNGMPACVKSETAEKMKIKGIASGPIKFTDLNKEVKEIASGPIKFTDLNKEVKAVTASKKEIESIPASSMSIVNFYITDHDLNLAHSGIEKISTKGLFEFTINGITIEGPENMIETGPNTGQFYIKLELPETIDGRPLNQEDVVLIKYLDASDQSGEQRVLVKSVPLTKTFANIGSSGGGSRIGHEFTLRIYEPDANRDSKNEDKISLNKLEFRGENGIRTTLSNPKFDANSNHLIETGPNTNTFEVIIKIPRELDGETIHIGDKYEIRYIDTSTPSNTNEKIILKGKIG